jgi:hypothetical protein
MSRNNITLVRADAHPTFFQDVNTNAKENLKNQRTLLSVTTDRESKLVTSDLGKLESSGNFNFTEKVDVELTGSNTRHLFRNLYGETPLTFLFFSKQNINNIQNVIRHLIYKELSQVIDNQNVTELMIIMRSIFLEYHRHPKLLTPNMSDDEKTKLTKQYTDEVSRLNDLVINESVPRIISQLQQYMDYLKDCSTPRSIMPKPQSASVTGTRSYRSVTSTLLGTTL